MPLSKAAALLLRLRPGVPSSALPAHHRPRRFSLRRQRGQHTRRRALAPPTLQALRPDLVLSLLLRKGTAARLNGTAEGSARVIITATGVGTAVRANRYGGRSLESIILVHRLRRPLRLQCRKRRNAKGRGCRNDCLRKPRGELRTL